MRRRSSKRGQQMALNLTSMMDMLTIILVFLLKSFSVSNVTIKPKAGIDLPESTAISEPKPEFALDISAHGIFYEDVRVQPLVSFQLPSADKKYETIFVLRNLLKQRIDEGGIVGESVIIRADREAPYDLIWRVMYTLRQLGFSQFKNLVIKAKAET